MTIKDIARLSGYSLGTVSRVLNNHPDVSDTARERIMAVVKEQGFEPNANARHLKMRQPQAVAVLVKGSQNMLFSDILERVQAKVALSGEEMFVDYLDEDSNEVERAAQIYRQRRPKGFMFLGGDLEFFRGAFGELNVPSVLLTNNAEELGFGNLSSFATDDEKAGEAAIDYLFENGHRHLGIIGGNLSVDQISYRRLKGVYHSIQKNGMEFDKGLQYEPCRYSMEEGYKAARKLIVKYSGLTAIFALGDVIALGAMRAIADMGLSVPQDISVIGFDGIASTQYSIPRLTTLRQDTEQLAEKGVRALLEGISYGLPPVHEYVGFKLIERESVSHMDITT